MVHIVVCTIISLIFRVLIEYEVKCVTAHSKYTVNYVCSPLEQICPSGRTQCTAGVDCMQ